MNPQEYSLNIRPGAGYAQTVKVSQGDVGRPLRFNLLDGSEALGLQTGTAITIHGTKPSGLGFTETCTWSGSAASVNTTLEMTQENGTFPAELVLTLGNEVIGTANFMMNVERSPHDENTIDGTYDVADSIFARMDSLEEGLDATNAEVEQLAASVPAVDATLTVSGAAADAKKTGDEITQLKSDLNDAYTQMLGSGELSLDLVANECVDDTNGSFIAYNNWSRTKLVNIAAVDMLQIKCGYQSDFNAFYDSNGDFISSFQVRTSYTTPEIPSNARYMAISSTTLGMSSLSCLFVTKQGKQTIELNAAVDTLTDNVADLESQLNGEIDVDYNNNKWQQGSWGAIGNWNEPAPNNVATRIRNEFNIKSGNPITIHIGSGYKFNYAAFTSNGTLLGQKLNWATNSIYINFNNISTVRIIIAKTDNTDITPVEYINSGIAVINFGNYVPVKLKVMNYNIGRYSHGSSPYYLESDFDEKVANLKAFFSKQMCDVVGLEEANDYLDSATTGDKSANSYIYDWLYPYHQDINGYTSIKSKYALVGKGAGQFSTGRQYVHGILQLGNKNIYILCVHLTPNADGATARATERTEIMTLIGAHKYAVCLGDFNAQTAEEYNDFTNSGYHIANGGYLPFVNTYGGLTVFQERNPFDNIVTTANIIIDNSERLDVFDDLVSDHVPFVAYLTVC